MLEEPSPPLHFRLAAGVLGSALAAGLPALSLKPERLLARARARTGLQDAGLSALENRALNELCHSAVEDAQLHPLGRLGVRDFLVNALVNRLLWVAAKSAAPARFTQPLNGPCLVVGLPRSGTTLLHRLLVLAEDARPLTTWEVQHPLPPRRGRDRRQHQVTRQLKNLYTMVPSLMVKHRVAADDAEEDFWLLNASLLSATFFVFAPLYGYEKWWRAQDMSGAYRLWAELLSQFQVATPGSRLVLKAPIHTAFLAEIVAAVPNIRLVQTHRDPTTVTASLNSLFHTLQVAVSTRRDAAELGRVTLDRVRWMAERNLQARALHQVEVFDVDYNELVNDPESTIAMIHEYLDVPFTATHRNRIARYLATQPEHERGKHPYSLEECGLTAREVEQALADYRVQFLQ